MTRPEALQDLELPAYQPQDLARDKEYVLKKLGFSPEEFQKIMEAPVRPHDFYDTDQWQYNAMMKIKTALSIE